MGNQERTSTGAIPPFLLNVEALELLNKLLLKKKALLSSIRLRKFGQRVTRLDDAERIFNRVVLSTQKVIRLKSNHIPVPKLVLTDQLSRLLGQTLRSYLFFLPLGVFLLFLGFHQSLEGALLLGFSAAILFLLLIPILFHRRVRIHVEHKCGYGVDEKGHAIIEIDNLHYIQFQSYLIHEYAHHLYAIHKGEGKTWMREGWARLVQWQVSDYLNHLENNPAYLYHALAQIIGELKFACECIASVLHKKLPWKIRLISTIYKRNPLFMLLTGTPGTDFSSLMNHAIGTASYFLAEKRLGFEKTLNEDLTQMLGD